MIDKLKNILGQNYALKVNDLEIKVYHITNYGVNQETYIKIKNSATLWTLYEVQRGESFEICQFEEFNVAICGLFIFTKKIFEHPKRNTIIKSKLNKCKENDLDIVTRILTEEFNEKLFSLTDFKKGAIQIENVNNVYDVCYCGVNNEKIIIVSGRTFSNALIVFYNYILLISEFENLIKYVTPIVQLTEEIKENLKCYFITK